MRYISPKCMAFNTICYSENRLPASFWSIAGVGGGGKQFAFIWPLVLCFLTLTAWRCEDYNFPNSPANIWKAKSTFSQWPRLRNILALAHFKKIPQGVTGAPTTHSNILLEKVAGDTKYELLVYLDDLTMFGNILKELECRFMKVLDKVEAYGLKLSLAKGHLCHCK